jgi:hypothetical protein
MRGIDGARETISVLDSQDMNFAIRSKSRVHEMLQYLKRLNGSVEQALDEVAKVNREIDSPGEFVEAVAVLRGELDRFTEEEVEQERKPLEQESMTEGDVELV